MAERRSRPRGAVLALLVVLTLAVMGCQPATPPAAQPATGKAPLVGVRMTEEFQAEIKTWSKKQSDDPPLATAIRRLVELGLKAKK